MILPAPHGRVALAIVALVASACGAPPMCTSSLACGERRVCGVSGRCERLREPNGARFATSEWRFAARWSDGRGGQDAIALGDGSEAWLEFRALPEASRILRALLVLQPIDAPGFVTADSEILVERVRAPRGRERPSPLDDRPARRRVPRGPARPVRIDVTEAARASAHGERTLHVMLRRRGGSGALNFGSPWAIGGPRIQPRLELLVH